MDKEFMKGLLYGAIVAVADATIREEIPETTVYTPYGNITILSELEDNGMVYIWKVRIDGKEWYVDPYDDTTLREVIEINILPNL